jgi:hypothetical protein
LQEIGNRREVIPVSSGKSAVTIDIADSTSISTMFKTTGRVDAVICACY